MGPQAERPAQTYVIRFRDGQSQKIIADEVTTQPERFKFYRNQAEIAVYIVDTIVGYHIEDYDGAAIRLK